MDKRIHKQSDAAFNRAKEVLVGGVNSPVRAFAAVGGHPPVIQKAKGAYLWDVDGNRYIDYVGSWGPAILGHAAPKVVKAIQDAAALGSSFGAPCEDEAILAGMVCDAIPSIEKLRFVSSGTEATMSALRLARGVTGRDKIIKFDGCYHGHADSLLVKAGSGALTLGAPDSAGIPEDFAKHTLVAEYNNLDSVADLLKKHGKDVAAIIVEPIAGNMGCVVPVAGFLDGLRALCNRYKTLLIFDEVMTGFRVGFGGAQARYDVTPDLTCLGKVLGGGLPVGAFGGRASLMKHLAPEGPVYQAGTLSGNPLAMAAGIATLKELTVPGVYEELSRKAQILSEGLETALTERGFQVQSHYVGGMWGLFFTQEGIRNLSDVKKANLDDFQQYFHTMLDAGVYLAPSAFEAGFVSLAHTDEDLQKTIEAAAQVVKGQAA